MAQTEITELLERLEAFEDRIGVRLDALYAYYEDHWDEQQGKIEVHVLGEIHVCGGTQLEKSVDVDLAIYDAAGRLVATTGQSIDEDTFFGFETFHLTCDVMKNQLARIRLKTTHTY